MEFPTVEMYFLLRLETFISMVIRAKRLILISIMREKLYCQTMKNDEQEGEEMGDSV